jgi:hypothetical protein
MWPLCGHYAPRKGLEGRGRKSALRICFWSFATQNSMLKLQSGLSYPRKARFLRHCHKNAPK